jgi:DNA-binding transcriptional regulator YiaG
MHQKRKTGRIEVLFRAINRISAEATTREDLSEELKSSGIDPAEFVKRIRSQLSTVTSPATVGPTKDAKPFTLPLISQLRKLSHLSSNEIARRLDVPLAFLATVERYLEITPMSWRAELARRIEQAFQISKDVALAIFENQSRLEIANLNQSSSDHQLTHEDILAMSEMDERSKQFWLDLARTR